MRRILFMIAAVVALSSVASAETYLCTTDLQIVEDPNNPGKIDTINSFYLSQSFPPTDPDAKKCDCDKSVFVYWYNDIPTNPITISSYDQNCGSTGPYSIKAHFAAGQNMPPEGAIAEYTVSGGRFWRAHCARDPLLGMKLNCSNGGGEYSANKWPGILIEKARFDLTQTQGGTDSLGYLTNQPTTATVTSIQMTKPNGQNLNAPTITSCPTGPNPERKCATWAQSIPTASTFLVTLNNGNGQIFLLDGRCSVNGSVLKCSAGSDPDLD